MTLRPAYWEDPEKTEFKSKIEEIDRDFIVLEETYFHPEGGGQPPDKGTINGLKVNDVQIEEDKIVHRVPNHDFEIGDIAEGKIDEEFRRYCMRCHTGSHVVFGAARKLFGKVGYSGFEIGEGKVRIDFETDAHIDRDVLLKLERLSNQAILDLLPLNFEIVRREEAENIRELAYAKEMPDQEEVRLVEIEGWDKATCSGTHLSNTIYVGRIHIIDKIKLQEGVTRINFAVGKPALTRDMLQKMNLLKVEKMLDTNYENLSMEIRNLLDKEKKLEEKLEELDEKILESELSNLDEYERTNYDLLLGSVSTENTELLSHRIKDNTNPGDVIVVVNERGTLSAVISVGKGVKDISANDLIRSLSKEFGGGGGGTDEFAQGGGFNTNPDELLVFVRNLL